MCIGGGGVVGYNSVCDVGGEEVFAVDAEV